METITIIKLKKCGWCGSEFIPRHNRQTYCTENGTYCKDEARKEQNRLARSRYYYKNYDSINGLGNSNLTEHMAIIKDKPNFSLEHRLIISEKERLKIC